MKNKKDPHTGSTDSSRHNKHINLHVHESKSQRAFYFEIFTSKYTGTTCEVAVCLNLARLQTIILIMSWQNRLKKTFAAVELIEMGGWIGRRLAQKHSELIFNTPICLTVFSEAEGTVTPRNRSGRDIWVVGVQRKVGDVRWQPVRHCNIRLIRPIQTHFKGTVQIYRTNAEGCPGAQTFL